MKVGALIGRNPKASDRKIYERLVEVGQSVRRVDFPSERSIGRIRSKLEREGRLASYSLAQWPETFESEVLPWAAAQTTLDLMRRYHEGGAPQVRLAKWYWRITESAPKVKFTHRFRIASALAIYEILNNEIIPPEIARTFELVLAWNPWGTKRWGEYERVALQLGVALDDGDTVVGGIDPGAREVRQLMREQYYPGINLEEDDE